MKFRSPGHEPVQIGMTSGHSAIVTPEGTELAPMFQREAIACGCLPVDVQPSPAAATNADGGEDGGFDRGAAIEAGLHKLLDSDDTDAFTKQGKPNLKALSERVGFNVPRDEADAAWDTVQAEL